MARVFAYVPDLMFGSRVHADLSADGHAVELIASGEVRDTLVDADVLIVDLTDEAVARTDLVRSLSADGSLDGVRTLAFYSHVDAEVRHMADSAGFDLVVPRSRMAREGRALIAQLIEQTHPPGSAA